MHLGRQIKGERRVGVCGGVLLRVECDAKVHDLGRRRHWRVAGERAAARVSRSCERDLGRLARNVAVKATREVCARRGERRRMDGDARRAAHRPAPRR